MVEVMEAPGVMEVMEHGGDPWDVGSWVLLHGENCGPGIAVTSITYITIITSIIPTARYTHSGMPIVDVSVSAGQQAVSTPWISTLCRDFNILVRISKANVDTDFGWLQLQFEGPAEEIQRATAWLMTTGMHIQAEQRAVGVS